MALSHGAVIALILLILGGVGFVLLQRSLDREATAEIVGAGREAAGYVAATGSAVHPPDSDVPSLLGVRVEVFLPDGRPVDRDEPAMTWLHPQGQPMLDLRVAGEPVRVVTIPARRAGRLIAIVVAGRSLVAEQSLLHRVRLLLLLGGLSAVAASVIAGWWLAGRAARPVRRAYEAQAGFAADASHEFRSPLAFIRAGVEVLGEDGSDLSGEVLGEIDYLTGLTERMLLLARADSGALKLATRSCGFSSICRSAARRAEVAYGLRTEIRSHEDPAVRADPVATAAALDAILENVAVYGGGRAEIVSAKGDRTASVEIVDHGPGMHPTDRERAFDRFFRADPARARTTRGGGLGLPIARRLVEAQGGSVSLAPTQGGGLTVRIELPLSEEIPAAASPAGPDHP
ncbi:MAG: sensor histidine kinase [Actinomycetota bacterium]